jgi:hypothetical protein
MQCSHHRPAGFLIAGISRTLQHSEQSPHYLPVKDILPNHFSPGLPYGRPEVNSHALSLAAI